ncbi:MAG: hypothetical protein U1E70_00565 [Acetobacteraceae bacterium]
MNGLAAELMALQYQFERSEWWPQERLAAAQFRQLGALVSHAAAQVPFYQDRLRQAGLVPDGPVTSEAWHRLPILTRRDLQANQTALTARAYPTDHGQLTSSASGGSTGVPVRVIKTALEALFWNANLVRKELWHRDKPEGHLVLIRSVADAFSAEQRAAARSPAGLRFPDWGPPCATLWQTGPATLMDETLPVAEQAAGLARLCPDYLLTKPASLRVLIAHCRRHGLRLPSLRQVWTLSEVVDDDLRTACQQVLGAPIVHDYSANEVGYIAVQCPEAAHFHVMAESVLVEVLDDTGRQCAPGETGRVVLTPLQNFAMPLLRYEIGDEAVVGSPCACGRGLPVLQQIIGRTLDVLTLPDGSQRRAELRHYRLARLTAVTEYQVVQRALDRIEVLLVLNRPLTGDEEAEVRALAVAAFGPEFTIDIRIVETIARTPAGKLRPFLSMIDPPPEGGA